VEAYKNTSYEVIRRAANAAGIAAPRIHAVEGDCTIGETYWEIVFSVPLFTPPDVLWKYAEIFHNFLLLYHDLDGQFDWTGAKYADGNLIVPVVTRIT
jgi:hypothetical protein